MTDDAQYILCLLRNRQQRNPLYLLPPCQTARHNGALTRWPGQQPSQLLPAEISILRSYKGLVPGKRAQRVLAGHGYSCDGLPISDHEVRRYWGVFFGAVEPTNG